MEQNRIILNIKDNFAETDNPLKFQDDVYHKLKEAEREAVECRKRFTHEEVFNELRCSIN